MPSKKRLTFITVASLAVASLAAPAQAQQPKELTFWSHWAAEMPKRTFVEEAIKRFEANNPGIKIKQTWYEKTALYAGLKTALRAGQAPDIFYAEPDQVEYMPRRSWCWSITFGAGVALPSPARHWQPACSWHSAGVNFPARKFPAPTLPSFKKTMLRRPFC